MCELVCLRNTTLCEKKSEVHCESDKGAMIQRSFILFIDVWFFVFKGGEIGRIARNGKSERDYVLSPGYSYFLMGTQRRAGVSG